MSNKLIPLIFYTIVSLIITAPLLENYIFLLDWTNAPTIKYSDIFYGIKESVSANMPLQLFREFLNIFISTSLFQKLLIFLMLFLSGVSMYSLINTKSKLPKYFAGLLYMVNPYVYIRFMAGHLLILLAYAITPFVIKSFIKFLDTPNKKQTIKTSLWITSVAIFDLHTLLLVLFFFFMLLTYYIVKNKDKKTVKNALINTFILGILIVVLNVYWILPLFTADSTKLSKITTDDLTAFQTRAGTFNEFMHTLMMYGFWRESAYILPKNIMPIYIYFPLFFIILLLTVHGYLNCKEKYKVPILITGVLAQLLAVGVGHPWFRNFFIFLFNNIYFIRGFREPQKFVAVLVFAYAFFSAYGIDNILHQIKNKKIKAFTLIFLVVPFAYTPTMFNSFWQQLKTTDYPQDWYEINDFLNQDKQDFNVLFLPWHLYMDFKWVPNKDKRIANPASSFFNKPIIQGDNVEVGRIYSSSTNPTSKYIESLLKKDITSIGEKLKPINVKYVILAKEVDYKNYFYLLNQTDLELIKETEMLYLFKNKNKVSKFYQSNAPNKELTPLEYKKESPVKYTIINPTKKFVIFTDTYNKNRYLGSQQPTMFEAVNLYEFKKDIILTYKRFNIYLISYLISIFTIIFLLIYLYYRSMVT